MNRIDVERLKSKNSKEAIIQEICHDFNMSPIIADAYYRQMEKYFEEHYHDKIQSGQLIYEAISKEEPAGKQVKECRKKSCVLTLNTLEDLTILEEKGLAECRERRIKRMTEEAKDQGAYLTCEDLAVILTTSVSSIKRDIKSLKAKGEYVVLRGRMKDIGRATSHKAKIVELFLENYQFTEIERLTRHNEKSIERYIKDFSQVALLTEKGLSMQEIRQVAGISKNLVQEYQDLYQSAKENKHLSQKLKEILSDRDPGLKKNSKKRGKDEK